MLKIVFLDFDGVLLPDSQAFDQSQQGLTVHNYLETVIFDPKCVSQVNHIIAQTQAQIVLSTSWARGHTFSQLCACLTRNHIDCSHIYEYEDPSLGDWRTPRTMSSDRAREILLWLEDHPFVKQWCALDDQLNIARLGKRAIVIDPQMGIGSSNAAHAINLLFKSEDQ